LVTAAVSKPFRQWRFEALWTLLETRRSSSPLEDATLNQINSDWDIEVLFSFPTGVFSCTLCDGWHPKSEGFPQVRVLHFSTGRFSVLPYNASALWSAVPLESAVSGLSVLHNVCGKCYDRIERCITLYQVLQQRLRTTPVAVKKRLGTMLIALAIV
jgi:hypothetical protein